MAKRTKATRAPTPPEVPARMAQAGMLAVVLLEEGLWHLQNLSESGQAAVIETLTGRIWDNGPARTGLMDALQRWAKEA